MVSSHRAQKAQTSLQQLGTGKQRTRRQTNQCRTPTPLPISQKSKQTQVTETNTWDGDGLQLSGRVFVWHAQGTNNKPRCKKNSSSLLQAWSLDSQMTCGLPQGHWARKFLLSSRLAEASRSKALGFLLLSGGSCLLPVNSTL